MSKWMRLVAWLVVLASVAVADEPPAAGTSKDAGWAAVPLTTLREAVGAGRVRARGTRPQSFRMVAVQVENRTDDRLAVDLCGSYLRPRRKGSCQRLGIGTPVDPRRTRRRGSGTVVINLEPRATFELQMNTCCLDAGKAAPSSQEFVATARRLPAVREDVLRWWADNPSAPQGAVNQAIWQNRETVTWNRNVQPTRRSRQSAAAYGGTYFRLRDGALLSLDEDGIERFLGTEIRTVIPTGNATYAVASGEDGRPDLWRFALTGPEPWGFVADVPSGETVRDVFAVGANGLVLVTDRAVRLLDRERRMSDPLLSVPLRPTAGADEAPRLLSAHPISDTRLLGTIRRPGKRPDYRGGEAHDEQAPVFEIWEVNLSRRKAERVKELWNVRSLVAGAAGTYGLSHRGVLRRMQGKSLRTLSGTEAYDRILHVGTRLVWLATSDGRVAAADARSGRERFRSSAALPDLDRLRWDRKTEDLVGATSDTWLRIRAATGKREVVTPPR